MKFKIGAAFLLGFAFASSRIEAQEFTFATLAGTAGLQGHVDGTRSSARFEGPLGVGVDFSGNIYVADNGGNNIRKVTSTGVVTTWVGSNTGASGTADGTGTAARFTNPQGISFDSSSNAYVSDTGNNTIRKITAAGVVTTLAGLPGKAGHANGTGSAASFAGSRGSVVDSDGNLFVADYGNSLIRRISPEGVVTTFAGAPYTSLINDDNFGSADGTGTAARFRNPSGIARDSAGNFYVTDTENSTVRKITVTAVVTTLAGSPGQIGKTDGIGSAARFNKPFGIAVDAASNVYVADTGNQTIRKITPGGVVTTVGGLAGQSGSADGVGSAARFYGPAGLAINAAGYLYVGDAFTNFLLRVGAPAGADTFPVFSPQPLDQTNMAGQNAAIAANVIGTPSPTCQWQRSINGGTTWSNLTNDAIYSGTTTATLTVAQVALAMQGDKFRCLASNSVGSTTSNAITLKIGPAYLFTMLAGSPGQVGSANGTGTAARFNMPNGQPSGVAVDSSGNIFVADLGNHIIRKVTPGGVVTTFAGSAGLFGSADGVGSNARFTNPAGLAFDPVDNLYVADFGNCTIRKIAPDGTVITVAGLAGTFGDVDGSGSAARFYRPSAIAVDRLGNLLVADQYNHKVKKITPSGQVSTLAGGGLDSGFGTGRDNGMGNNAYFSSPKGVAVDAALNVYVVDSLTVRKITPTGEVTTLAGGSFGSTFDGPGAVARFSDAAGIAMDAAGTAYVTDSSNRTIRMITQSGMVSTLAGTVGVGGTTDGIGTNTQFSQPMGIAIDGTGRLYVTDAGSQTIRLGTVVGGMTGPVLSEQPSNQILKDGHHVTFSVAATALPVPSYQWQVSADSGNSWENLADGEAFAGVNSAGLVVYNTSSVPSGSPQFRCVVSNGQGVTNSNAATLTHAPTVVGAFTVTTWAGFYGYYGVVDGAVADARFHAPTGMAFDQAGALYVADTLNHTIRKITGQGVVSTFAGMAGTAGSADGVGTAAQFYKPTGIAIDSTGNVYVADRDNDTIRKITPAGVVTTLAGLAQQEGWVDGVGENARFAYPTDLAVDATGNLYVTDLGNYLIRKVTPAGVVTTIAGGRWQSGHADGTGSEARFTIPSGIAVDSSGNLYVADTSTIRKITPQGVVTTLAGRPNTLGSTDGYGTEATFYRPRGLSFDGAGNLYVVDSGTHLLRQISPTGYVTTLAGSMNIQGAYDGSGSNVEFNTPSGIVVDKTGTVYIADTGNHSIRKGIDGMVFSRSPTITTHPTSCVVAIGDAVTFTSAASGVPAPTYQWQKNGADIDGATDSTYTIDAVAENDAGSYKVVASNIVGSATSDAATLTAVIGAPSNAVISITIE